MLFDDIAVLPPASAELLEPPAPYPGGKRLAAALVWSALGPVNTLIDPFCGLLAVPLACPWGPRKNEVINDKDGLIINVWRAIQAAPLDVARLVDWPVSELDMLARRDELVSRRDEVREKLRRDPRYFDVELAAWWLWGACQWIGGGWCAPAHVGRDGEERCEEKRPVLSRPRRGVLKATGGEVRPVISGQKHGFLRAMGGEKKPCTNSLGRGVHRPGLDFERYFLAIAARCRTMKFVSGEWHRVLGRSTLGIDTAHGLTPTGVFLDPPYAHTSRTKIRLYAEDEATTSAKARAWALAHGDDARLRIVLAGYEGEHDMPASWRCVAWKSQGATQNADKERLWLSPHCLGGTAAEPLFR